MFTYKKSLALFLSSLVGSTLFSCGNNDKTSGRFTNEQPVIVQQKRQVDYKDTQNNEIKQAVFRPQNANIVDSEGSHNFESFDCPNMNVTDRGNSVKAAWGGIEIILSQTTSNEDTYYASGETSRGKVTLTAYRSSRSGEIYLVTAQMPNPSPDVKFITINFKP